MSAAGRPEHRHGCIITEDTHGDRVNVVLRGCYRRSITIIRILSRLRLQIENANGVREDIDIICGVRDAATVNVNHTARTHGVEVIDALSGHLRYSGSPSGSLLGLGTNILLLKHQLSGLLSGHQNIKMQKGE